MIEKHQITDRAEWLQRRALDLTASDIGAAAGVDKFKTRLGLYAEKTGAILPPGDTKPMRRGRWLESAVLAAIREERPDWEVRPVGFYYRDPELRLGATPDFMGVTDQPGITNIQAKVVSRPTFERDWAEGPPLSYQLQTLCEAMLMDAQRSIVAALVIDTYNAELELFPLPRHDAAERNIRQIAEAFWDSVREGRAPPADYAQDREVIEALHPTSVAEPVLDLTGDNELSVLLPRWAALKAGMKTDAKEVAEIETAIKAKLGDAERASLPGWDVSWKSQHRKETIVKASSYRVLRVRDLDEKEEAAA